jgi:hypothetical protein
MQNQDPKQLSREAGNRTHFNKQIIMQIVHSVELGTQERL